MSQYVAAKRLKINVGFWSRIESGKIELPSKYIKRTAKVLGVTRKKLVDLKVEQFHNKLKRQVYGH